MKLTPEVNLAFQSALKAQKNAYAPYSNFHVGAAIKVKDHEELILGCNVENASYGATVCAERVAIANSVVTFGKPEFEYLVVVTNTHPAIGPCALCLQVMSEFCDADMPVYFANKNGVQSSFTFKELLPNPFSKIPQQI